LPLFSFVLSVYIKLNLLGFILKLHNKIYFNWFQINIA